MFYSSTSKAKNIYEIKLIIWRKIERIPQGPHGVIHVPNSYVYDTQLKTNIFGT